jgi:hypothetical protein
MNRHTQRRIEALRRHLAASDLLMAPDHAGLVCSVTTLVAADPTGSGAPIITSEGELRYIDAGMLRRGGRA